MYTIYQDMDGCIADFCAGFSTHVYNMVNNPLSYNHSKTLKRAIPEFIEKYGKRYRVLSEEEVNDPICKPLIYKIGAMNGFFYSLPLLDNGVWDIVKNSGYDIKFLSAPIGDYAVEDKTRWIREKLKSSFDVIIVPREEKIHYGGPNAILIDDYEKTCKEWWDAGFKAFHWRPGREQELSEFLGKILPRELLDTTCDFDEYYNRWRTYPGTRYWQNQSEWKIIELEVGGVVYHASFFMSTRSLTLFQMKPTPWANGEKYALEIDKRILSHEFGRTI